VLTAVWTAMGLVVWAMFPKTAAVLLPLCSIAPLAWTAAARAHLRWQRLSPAIAALLLGAAYLLANATWSLSPQTAASTVAFALVMVPTLHIVLKAVPELDEPPLRAMAAGTIAGLALAVALLGFEVFSGQALRRLLIHFVPALQPGPPHARIEGGQLVWLAPYLPNAGIGVLTLIFWPALLAAARLGMTRASAGWLMIASGAVTLTVLASEHATSQVALAGAAAVFVLSRVHARFAIRLVIAAWVAANALVVPAVSLLYSADAYRAPWLPHSARHRIVIWGYTSAQVPKAPLFGAGIGTARAVNTDRDPDSPLAPGTPFHLATNLHSHNAYLQVWYETGAAGAIILLGLGLLIIRSMMNVSPEVQPYLLATFSSCALMAASSYSIWAPWFMGSLAMTSVLTALGAAPCLHPGDRRRQREIAPSFGHSLQLEEADHRAGVRPDQPGTGLPPVPAAPR
jgi:O-antigen ligase